MGVVFICVEGGSADTALIRVEGEVVGASLIRVEGEVVGVVMVRVEDDTGKSAREVADAALIRVRV